MVATFLPFQLTSRPRLKSLHIAQAEKQLGRLVAARRRRKWVRAGGGGGAHLRLYARLFSANDMASCTIEEDDQTCGVMMLESKEIDEDYADSMYTIAETSIADNNH